MPLTEPTPANVSRQYFDPIPGIIPFGSLCLIAGASGVGKTIMLAEWCARLRDGRSIWHHRTNRPTAFYYIAADRDWSTYRAAFDAVGFPEITHFTLAESEGWDPLRQRDVNASLKLLEWCLDQIAPIPGSLVIIDPVAPIFIQGDSNRAKDVALSMHYLRRLARRYQITLLCAANVGKPKMEELYKRPQDRIAGSGAFVAYTDTQIFMFEGDEPHEPRTLGWTPRRAPYEEFQVVFDKKTMLWIPAPLQDESPELKFDRPSQLLLLIPDDGITSNDLYELAREKFNISRATFQRDLIVLLRRQLITRDSWGTYKRAKLN